MSFDTFKAWRDRRDGHQPNIDGKIAGDKSDQHETCLVPSFRLWNEVSQADRNIQHKHEENFIENLLFLEFRLFIWPHVRVKGHLRDYAKRKGHKLEDKVSFEDH